MGSVTGAVEEPLVTRPPAAERTVEVVERTVEGAERAVEVEERAVEVLEQAAETVSSLHVVLPLHTELRNGLDGRPPSAWQTACRASKDEPVDEPARAQQPRVIVAIFGGLTCLIVCALPPRRPSD
jgi:hypothetical protein